MPAGRPSPLLAGALGFLCFAIYLTSLKPPDAADSMPTRLLPFSILRQGDFDLREFQWLVRPHPRPYFLRRAKRGRIYSRYPVATSLLVTPLAVPAVWWLEHNEIEDDDVRFRLAALVVERVGASAMAAGSVVLVFLALCHLTSVRVAAGIALAYGLGSNTWATSSQALWQHTAAQLSLAALNLVLVVHRGRMGAAAAGTFAALAVLTRPTMVIFAALTPLYFWRRRREHLVASLALPALGAVALLAYNVGTVGSIAGGYAGMQITPDAVRAVTDGGFGLLLSPSRGLLVFTPAAILGIAGFLRRPYRSDWIPYLGLGCAVYFVSYASFSGWYGGATYGPRFLVDTYPALALAAVPVVEGSLRSLSGRLLLGVLAVYGVLVQAVGVYGDYHDWNSLPAVVDRTRSWQWSDPQILRTLGRPWQGTRLAPLLRQAATEPTAALLRPLESTDLHGEIVFEGPAPLRVAAGTSVPIAARLTNRSHVAWPAFSDYGFLECRVVYVWDPPFESERLAAGSLTLPKSLAPGESIRLSDLLEVPRNPGEYTLRLSLVQMLAADHGIFGNTAIDVPIVVE